MFDGRKIQSASHRVRIGASAPIEFTIWNTQLFAIGLTHPTKLNSSSALRALRGLCGSKFVLPRVRIGASAPIEFTI